MYKFGSIVCFVIANVNIIATGIRVGTNKPMDVISELFVLFMISLFWFVGDKLDKKSWQ